MHLDSLLLDSLFEFIVVVGFPSEADRFTRVTDYLIEFEAEVNVDPHFLKLVEDNLLDIRILEGIWIVD